MKDRVLSRYKAAVFEPSYGDAMEDAFSDAADKVTPTIEDLTKMVKEGIEKGCQEEGEKDADLPGRGRNSVALDWRGVEVQKRGNGWLVVEFPNVIAYSGENDSELSAPRFEVFVRKVGR